MDLLDNIKETNIHIIRVMEGEEREKAAIWRNNSLKLSLPREGSKHPGSLSIELKKKVEPKDVHTMTHNI